jgi:carboxymethylenebutenolidase
LLLHYASLDERINSGIPAFDSLKKASIDYKIYMYGAQHAFNNDMNPARYNKRQPAHQAADHISLLKKPKPDRDAIRSL